MPITMYDTYLSTDVDVYQFGIPDTFGCNTLIYYKGDSPLFDKYKDDPKLSAEYCSLSNCMWMTVNARRLDPEGGSSQ